MADFDKNTNLMKNNMDTSNISINIKKHIKHGRHRTKYNFRNDPGVDSLFLKFNFEIDKLPFIPNDDIVDKGLQEYNGIDNIKYLQAYMEEMNLGEVEFSVFQCKSSKANIPAYYANIKLGNVSLSSSFPEKYSLPEVAKQVAARNALAVLKKNHSVKNQPITEEMELVARRLEHELKKNFGGLFCDKVENIYKEVYNESLPSDWLIRLNSLSTNIIIEHLPILNKSILHYSLIVKEKNHEELIKTSMADTCNNNFPLMKFVDKTERSVTVTTVDINHTLWILFVHDSINDDFDTLFKLMNMPDESKHFIKMFSVELFDVYAVQIENNWYRFQVIKIDDDCVTGIFIDLGVEWCVVASNVMLLPQKFLEVPSQAIKCALTSLVFAPYFHIANDLFHQLLFDKEFIVVPDNIDEDIPFVTLYNGKCNVNSMIMDAFLEKTNFKKIDGTCKGANLSNIANGYIYLHSSNETLLIMESILYSISISRPLDQLYSTTSISPHKVYLVKCTQLQTWSRAVINDFIFTDQKFKVYFIDYGNYGLIDQDKFIDLQSIDPLLAAISPQALKVSFHLFPPKQFTASLSKALEEMTIDKSLDIKVVSTDNDGVQVVEIYDSDDKTGNCISFNTQLYQRVERLPEENVLQQFGLTKLLIAKPGGLLFAFIS